MCGPVYRLVDAKGNQIENDDPIQHVAQLLGKNRVVAIQGIAGTHIATKTSDSKAIEISVNHEISGGIGFRLQGNIEAYFDDVHVSQIINISN